MHRRLWLPVVLGALLLPFLMAPTQAGPRWPGGHPKPPHQQPHHDPWTPPYGAVFNNPVGSLAERTANVARVVNAIRHTPRGETIRMAIYSFDRSSIADELLKAHKRGVHVQMVLNDNWISAPTVRLQRALGHNPQKSSFVRLCHGSCRGGPGNLHLKVYAFSRTGSAKDVVITGSSNLTDRAVSLQWNDLYTVADDGLYGLFVKIFNQLKLDKPHRPRWVEYSSDQLRANFYRTKSGAAHHVRVLPAPRRVSQADDPVMKRLRAVRCRTAKGFGIDRRTSIRIIMYAWQGNRGKYIAERVARLKREGCSVRIILSVPGGGVLKVLHGAGIAMRSADWNYLPSGIVNMYSHLKVLMVDGTYRGKPTRTLWTGSENWSPMSFRNDELTIQLSKPKAFSDYRRRFASLWLKGTHELGVHPTGKPQG